MIDPLTPGALSRELLTYNATALPEAHMRLRAVVDSGELYRDHGVYGSALDDAYGDINPHSYAPMTIHLKQRDVAAWVHHPTETSTDK